MDKIRNIFATHKGKVIAASSAALAVLIAAGILIAAKASTTAKTATKPTATTKAEKYAESVVLNKSSVTLTEGQHDKLTATVKPTDAIDKTVQWSSSNKTVCTVSDGAVTAQGIGTAAVTATTLNGKATVCTVTVSVPVHIKKTVASIVPSQASTSTGTNKTGSSKKYNNDDTDSNDWQSTNPESSATKTGGTQNNDQSSQTPPPKKDFFKTVSGCNIKYSPYYRSAQVFVDVTSINQEYYKETLNVKIYRNGVYDAKQSGNYASIIGKNRNNVDVAFGVKDKEVNGVFYPIPAKFEIICYHNNTKFKTITFSVNEKGFT